MRNIKFTGDATEEAEKDMMDSGLDLYADVYKVGHHGSNTSSCWEFIKAIDPSKNCRPVCAVSEKQAITVWWKCSRCGHEWQAAITGRAQGRDCPKCCR